MKKHGNISMEDAVLLPCNKNRFRKILFIANPSPDINPIKHDSAMMDYKIEKMSKKSLTKDVLNLFWSNITHENVADQLKSLPKKKGEIYQ